MTCRLTLVLAPLLVLASAPAGAVGPAKRLSAAPRGDAPVKIDGRLDEPVWATAKVGTGFVERTPFPGRRAAVRTEFRVLYDAEALYIGVVNHRSEGDELRAFERQRDDFDVFSDDAISLKFDVRLDQRTTVGFATNPAGVQIDYVAVENSDFRREYDAIWEVEAQVYPDRWVAEFRIPFVALGLPGDPGDRVLGLQLSRDHNAALATYDWSEMPPEFGPVSALYYGRLEGLEDVAGGRPLVLLPYGLAGLDTTEDKLWQLRAGGDVQLRLGTDTWGELTVLTDFAQVDLDDPVVNFDRFPLFFPERRPFFLTGIDVFEFGNPGFAQIYFSRRIGLDDQGNTVPILSGLKSYGSVDDFRFGVLQVVTAETDEAPGASYSVSRLRYNFGERGHVGLQATLRGDLDFLGDRFESEDSFEPDYAFGVDGAVRGFDRRLSVSGFWAGAINTDGDMKDGHTGDLTVGWSGENVSPSIGTRFISEDFDPVVGFAVRPDLWQNRVDLRTILRPDELGLRSVALNFAGQIETAMSDQSFLGQRFDTYLSVESDSGLFFGFFIGAIEDVVRDAFDLSAADRTIEAGRYRGVLTSFEVITPQGRNPSVGGFYEYSSAYFGGAYHRANLRGAVSFGAWGQLSAQGTVTWLDFPDQAVVTQSTVQGKLSLTPTTTLVVDLIGQGNTDAEIATGLLRVRWRYLPGSDLFLVYREQLDFSGPRIQSDRSATLKVGYRFDVVL